MNTITVKRRALNAHPVHGECIADITYPRDIVNNDKMRLIHISKAQREANKYGYIYALIFHLDAPIYIYPAHIRPVMNKCGSCYSIELELRNAMSERVDAVSHRFIGGDDSPCDECGARP